MPRYVQPMTRVPTGIIPTSQAVLPYGVKTLGTPKNVTNLDFGFDYTLKPKATIRNQDQLFACNHNRDFFGGRIFDDSRAMPGAGIPENFRPVYRDYPEFNSPNTRDPRCLHPVRKDCLELVMRQTLKDSSDTHPYEMGLMRLGEHMKPGRYLEVRAKWPDPNAFGAYTFWPVVWTFTGEQPYKTRHRYFTKKTFECDSPDGYSDGMRRRHGHSFVIGYPNGTGSPIRLLYASNRHGLETVTGGDGYEGRDGKLLKADRSNKDEVNWNAVARFRTNEATDPTNGFHTWGLYFHKDGRTISHFYDGVLYRQIDAAFGVRMRDAYRENDGVTPAIDPARADEFLGHHVMIGLQALPNAFNHDEVADVETREPDVYYEGRYSIDYVRMWEADIEAVPESRTPEIALAAPQTAPADLGDLPRLSTGTYVADVSAHTGALRCRFGNAVRMLGSTSLGAAKLDGLPAPEHDGGRDGGVSLRGPAVARFQGAHRVHVFLAFEAINAYAGKQHLFSANRDFPLTGEFGGKLALTSYNSPRRMEFRCDGASGAQSLASAGMFSADVLEVVSLVKTTNAEGRVVLGMTEHRADGLVTTAAPAATGGLPVSDVDGFSELTFLCGRDKWALPAVPAAARLIRAVIVAVTDGAELSAADHEAVVARMKAKRA